MFGTFLVSTAIFLANIDGKVKLIVVVKSSILLKQLNLSVLYEENKSN